MTAPAASRLRFAWAAILFLCALPRFGATADAETNAPALLRRGDALLVHIENLGGELPEYREIVDSEGRIELPFLGFFHAEGKSLAAVAAEMAEAYANAKLSSNATVRLSFITHFDPAPDRSNLVRIQDPRRPVAAVDHPVP